jgi:tetratricopeptide (TPR) repeat protein
VTDDQLARYLASLDREELVRRMTALARRDPQLRLALEAEAEAASSALDVRKLKKELTAQLRVTNRSYDRRYARRYAQQADAALDVLAALLDAGLAEQVVVLAEHCMKRIDTADRAIDDSGGYVATVADRLRTLHRDACLAARLDARALGFRLAEWALSDESDREWFLDALTRYADVLGDEGLAAFRERVEPEWDALPPLPPARTPSERSWDSRRFRITFLREGLARAGGSVDELVEVLARDLSSPRQFERIAEVLEQAGREREALAWLERGSRAYGPAGDAGVRSRLLAAYLRDGQVEDALELAARAHAQAPSLRTYEELRTAAAAAGEWAQRRDEALERLRGADRFGGRSSAVRAQLGEGDLDGAWADAGEGGCDPGTWLELADASREHRPEDAVRVYGRLVEDALEIADDRQYARVVDLLGRWRDTLRLHGRERELDLQVAAIRELYARRKRLLQRLDSAGFV